MKMLTLLLRASLLCWLLPSALAGELDEYSIDQLQQKMQRGELSAKQITEHYLQQIERYNSTLRAVITVNPNAVERAEQLDQQRAQGKIIGPMHGIPVLVKDNIDTNDGMPNTAGSYLLKDHKPNRDAFLVAKLRESGAIILGKANLSEWANFRSTNSSSGWSAMGQQAKNPYDITRSPCGSSAGSGVAVAANFAPVAVGTETDGSVICPSSINGLVGIKPTLGLVSRFGIIPISKHQDTAGPMAKTVTDAVYLLEAMVGKDSRDEASFALQRDLTKFLNASGLKGKRIGIVTNLKSINGEVGDLFNQAVAVIKQQQAELVPDLELPTAGQWGGDEWSLLTWSFKSEVAAYLADFPQLKVKTLADLMAGNERESAIEFKHFGQEIFAASEASKGEQEQEYEAIIGKLKQMAGRDGIDALMSEHKLDLLIAPTAGPAWKIDHINGDHFQGASYSASAVSGYPHITVPMGNVRGMPVGISFFAGKNAEPILIEAAYAYEQATKHRTAPDLSNIK